jgi:hypothetical protein
MSMMIQNSRSSHAFFFSLTLSVLSNSWKKSLRKSWWIPMTLLHWHPSLSHRRQVTTSQTEKIAMLAPFTCHSMRGQIKEQFPLITTLSQYDHDNDDDKYDDG